MVKESISVRLCRPNPNAKPLCFCFFLNTAYNLISITIIKRAIYQLAKALEYNKYLSYLSKNGSLLQEKKHHDIIMYG